MIPNYEAEIEKLRQIGTSGFILAFNMTFRGPEHLHSEYPKLWRRIYEERNYYFVDPVLLWGVSRTGNKRWSEIRLPDVRNVMTEARKFDLNYGAVFSRKYQYKRSFLTVARADRELTDVELEVLGSKFDSWVEMVVGNVHLTEAEQEVLRYLRDGLGQREIADTLGISESAVKQRVQKACSKLQAKTRAQAVAIAVARNLLDR